MNEILFSLYIVNTIENNSQCYPGIDLKSSCLLA